MKSKRRIPKVTWVPMLHSRGGLVLQTETNYANKVLFQQSSAGAVTQRCSVKKEFSKILQNSQDNACATVSGTGAFP